MNACMLQNSINRMQKDRILWAQHYVFLQGRHSPLEVKLVKRCAYWTKRAASIDLLINDLSHCVSLASKHSITKRASTNFYWLSNPSLQRPLLMSLFKVFDFEGHWWYWSFQNVFALDISHFSQLKFKVNKGINLWNLCFKIKTKTYLVFISMVTIHSACHC